MTLIDLHIHSIYSCDGEYTPETLVSIAKKAGLKAIAITDHNNTSGVEEGIRAGTASDIKVVPAIELDCIYQGVVFHVLGYGIDYKSDRYKKVYEDIADQEVKAAARRIRLVHEMGIDIDEGEAMANSKNGFVTAEIIAEIALNKPENRNNPLLQPYCPGGSRSDNPYVNFYWDICAQGKPGYVPIDYISMEEAVTLIKETGGIPVLAHPGNNLKGKPEMLTGIVGLGMKGIEAYSSYHTSEQNKFYISKAKENQIFITGGSDFHGKTKPSISMGSFGMPDDGLDILSKLNG